MAGAELKPLSHMSHPASSAALRDARQFGGKLRDDRLNVGHLSIEWRYAKVLSSTHSYAPAAQVDEARLMLRAWARVELEGGAGVPFEAAPALRRALLDGPPVQVA